MMVNTSSGNATFDVSGIHDRDCSAQVLLQRCSPSRLTYRQVICHYGNSTRPSSILNFTTYLTLPWPAFVFPVILFVVSAIAVKLITMTRRWMKRRSYRTINDQMPVSQGHFVDIKD